MGILSLLKNLKNRIILLLGGKLPVNNDEIHLNLDGLEIFLERCFSYDTPHEVTIVVPRAELRKKVRKDNVVEEIEILLNSITVVHSPQRPSNEGEGPLPIPPEIPERVQNIVKQNKRVLEINKNTLNQKE